ncbi:MAG: hypothetical protein UV38_C0002G0063 [candidate division TM6 bacterium GW2011_GWE2_42_60]|nr:MAG: hypothetical protein UV38_C0002G0063 [candidate division TM6 bacterium GW2011_GWE2_42_60]HBY06181.1 hypothetical protein [Candidatus Dependentiae bacterium]
MKITLTHKLLSCLVIIIGSSTSVVATEALSNDTVIVTINSKPAITVKNLIFATGQLDKEQPMLKQLVPLMSKDDQFNFYQELATRLGERRIISIQSKEKGWDAHEQFKEALKKEISKLTQGGVAQPDEILMQYAQEVVADNEFQKRILAESSVSDKDAEEFYNKNVKRLPEFQRPPFIAVPSGIKTFAVRVDDPFEAQYLMEKAVKTTLKQAADELHKEVLDLGVLSQYAKTVDPALLQKGEDMEAIPKGAFPVWDTVQSADKRFFYVVLGTLKTGSEYAPFSSVKNEAKEVINALRFAPRYEEALKRLRDENKMKLDEKSLRLLLVPK